MKKFFSVNNGKKGIFVAKNLIIFAVLIAVCGLSVWSWFTWGQRTDANGLNVKSIAEGVQVSWDGEDFYDHLTARANSQIEPGKIGLAKNVGNPLNFDLITGNGEKFFEPYINRRTGLTLTNPDSSWQGVVVDESNSDGRFVDIDLYFRSLEQRDVFLAGDSTVSPKALSGNYSDYGTFTKDYISAASRVAFLNVDKTEDSDGTVTESIGDCSFVWAPNSNIHLVENESGYEKETELIDDEIGGGGTTTGGLDGGAVKDDNDYYLWTIDTEANYAGGDQRKITDSYKFEYDENIRYYVATFNVIVPSYQAENPSIPFLISNSESSPLVNTYAIDRSLSFAGNHNDSLLKISNQDYNAATFNDQQISANLCSQFYITKTNTLIQGTNVEVKFGFNPQTNKVTVLGYKGNDSWGYGYDEPEQPIPVKYFEIDNNDTCALVNPESGVAFSRLVNFRKNVNFKDADKIFVSPLSITMSELFTVVKTGDGYEATYKFKNAANNQYLTVTSGALSFTDTGSEFTLKYVEGLDCPALVTNGYCLVVNNGVVKAVAESSLNINEAITVYTGTSYQLITNSSPEVCTYYDYDAKEVKEQNASSSPKLFATPTTLTATEKVGNTKIVTLTKENEDDAYYTAHIVIRIWVEGTDREAKTPLADGVFNVSLHFTSI